MISYTNIPKSPFIKHSSRFELLNGTIQNIEDRLGKEKTIVGSGSQAGFKGPFGWRKYLYVDYTATGRSLTSIEKFIGKEVLPHYANTHTTVSNTSLQTTLFRNQARETIKMAVGGGAHDEVIFCGAGATAAIHKLLHLVSHKSKKLVVILGPYEHHSNILPWREKAYEVVQVPVEPLTGKVNVKVLRKCLLKYTLNPLQSYFVVGCFSAGSNITGEISDDIAITQLLHQFGALSFWDYAAAAPHVKIQMNPGENTTAHKDAIFFSGHKFEGGPQTPGVLVVKKNVFKNKIPHGVGGGTVLFVTKNRHKYSSSFTEREEGGTPNIIGSIRLGLAFLERNKIGIENITQREAMLTNLVLSKWEKLREIKILGNIDNPRLPIVSFIIEHLPSGYFLHHNFVVALLNDLFGIQCRGGCMCAGPYAQDLLGIDDKLAKKYESALKNKSSMGTLLKPGFVRVSISYSMSLEETKFLIDAVHFIAKYGWRLLSLYKIDWKAASFVVRGFKNSTISLYSYGTKQVLNQKESTRLVPSYSEMFTQAKDLVSISWKFHPKPDPIADQLMSGDAKSLRSFMLPIESYIIQASGHVHTSLQCSKPYRPPRWGLSPSNIIMDYGTPLTVPFQLSGVANNTRSLHVYSTERKSEGKVGVELFPAVEKPSQFAPYLLEFRRASNDSSIHGTTNFPDSEDDGIFMY